MSDISYIPKRSIAYVCRNHHSRIMEIKEQVNTELLPPAAQNFWQALGSAVAGSDADYTRIALNRAILLLAVPMILELVFESTFAIVDIYFVGKLGPSAVATVGLTETYLFLLYSVS